MALGFRVGPRPRWSRTPPISPGSAITSLSIPFAPELSPPTGWANLGAAASGNARQRPHAIGSSPPNGCRLSDSRPKAIPGAHTSTLGQTSRQRATTIALGAAPTLAVGRLAQQAGGGRAPANPPIWRCHRKCPPGRSPKSSARGGHRHWPPRSKKPASLWRTRQARQKASDGRSPSPGLCEPRWPRRIVGSRRHCRGVIPPPCAAISRRGHCNQRTGPVHLAQSTWPRPPGPVAKDGFPIEDDSLFAPASGAGGSGGRRDPGKFTPESNQGMSHRGPAAQPSGYRVRQCVFALWTRCPNSVRSTEKIFAERVRRSVRIVQVCDNRETAEFLPQISQTPQKKAGELPPIRAIYGGMSWPILRLGRRRRTERLRRR